jgi:hypothetical protein
MKNLLLFTVATFCSFFSYGQPAHKVIALDDRTHLPDTLNVVAQSNIIKCYERWAITHDTIVFDFLENSPDYEIYKNSLTVVAVTNENTIYFRRSYLKEASASSFKNVLTHEMFHTVAGEIRLLDTTYSFMNPPDDVIITVVGFKGLDLLTTDFQFSELEEAAAEYCSFFINNERLATKYQNTAYFLSLMVDSNWIAIEDIVKASRNSDLVFFCSKILNKKASILDVVNIVAYFNSVQEGQSDPNWAFEKIKREMRK